MLRLAKRNELSQEQIDGMLAFWTTDREEGDAYKAEIKWVAGKRGLTKGEWTLFLDGEGEGSIILCDHCDARSEWLAGNCVDYEMDEGGRCPVCGFPSDKKSN